MIHERQPVQVMFLKTLTFEVWNGNSVTIILKIFKKKKKIKSFHNVTLQGAL